MRDCNNERWNEWCMQNVSYRNVWDKWDGTSVGYLQIGVSKASRSYSHNTSSIKSMLCLVLCILSPFYCSLWQQKLTLFAQDQNIGLLIQAIKHTPHWALKHLMVMYVTLGLADIAKVVNIQSKDEVRDLVLRMVCLSSPWCMVWCAVQGRG